jgi:formiminotetrahydrofolate cyclodeaminase
MVTAYSTADDDPSLGAVRARFAAARARFVDLVAEDAQAYTDTVAERRAAKSEPGPEAEAAWMAAIRHAAEVPLETAELAFACARELRELADAVRPMMKSDWTTALAMLGAALKGALANVVINADDLRGRGADVSDLEAAVGRMS